MKPYAGPDDLGLVMSVSKTVIPFGYNLTVGANATIINYGSETETANFTFQMPTVSFEQELTVGSRNSTILTFVWDTTGFERGNYSTSASLEPVTGETEITHNA